MMWSIVTLPKPSTKSTTKSWFESSIYSVLRVSFYHGLSSLFWIGSNWSPKWCTLPFYSCFKWCFTRTRAGPILFLINIEDLQNFLNGSNSGSFAMTQDSGELSAVARTQASVKTISLMFNQKRGRFQLRL